MEYDIPHEIIIDILSRLPVASLLRFKSVCKSWYSLINNNSYFIRLHLDRSTKLRQYVLMIPTADHMYSVDVPHSYRPAASADTVSLNYPFKTANSAVSILGSCNGIFLIGIYDRHVGLWVPKFSSNEVVYSDLCLWNPSTKQYKKLPTTLLEIPKDRRNRFCEIVFGLGYDSSTDDYKVIRIFYDYFQCPETKFFDYLLYKNTLLPWESEVHVYSMQRNTCQRIKDNPSLCIKHEQLRFIQHGIYASGAIHWLARPTRATDRRFSSAPIVSFDVTSEKFSELQTPDFNNTFDLMSFGVLDGCLCVYVRFDDMHVDGFMMKESWTKIFSVGLSSNSCVFFKALWFTNDGELYLHTCLTMDNVIPDREFYLQTCATNDYVILYEPEEECIMHELKLRGVRTTYPQHFKVEPYIRSLVSLNA